VALLLLAATVAASGLAAAVLIAPPFLAAGLGVRELDRRLDAAGADFTRIPRFPQRSTIYANDGKTVLAHVYLDNREILPLRQISKPFQRAVLAIEDSTFYEHGALNVRSIIRAALANIREGEVVEGGSTITIQLVKNTLGLDPTDVSFERKFQEAALAVRVEQKYTKDQILAMYLNQVYLGNRVYGIATASQFYFHVPARKLNLAQAAMLAGMIRAPAYYDPIVRPHKAWLRRNDVLNRMQGLGWITEERTEKLKATPLGLAQNIGEPTTPEPPFIVQYVKEQLVQDPFGWYAPALGETKKERERALSEGGLHIVTTFDPEWQRAAERTARQPWSRFPEPPPGGAPADLAIVSVDNRDGAIRTMLSGRNFKEDEVNTVTSVHQPGSSFKPYVLAAAFENGVAPTATYSGVQGTIADPRCETNGAPWNVINAEGSSRGDMDLYAATADSVNAVFARLILDAGVQETAEMAERMGVLSPLPPVCSLATGSVGISPLDQASGYQTLANSGVHCKPFAVTEITRGEQILYRHHPDCERVLPASTANLITDMLKGPVEHGTAASVFSSGWGPWPTAGKTGTADLNKAIWFVGYTRQISTAVWVGSSGDPYSLEDRYGGDLFGSSLPAPIWKEYMLLVMQGFPAVEFPEPNLVPVPSVIGMSEDEAIAVLKEAGFKVDTAVIGSYLPAGTVATQNPSGGTSTLPGATVQLGISNGIPPVSLVPTVRGLTLEEAVAALEAENFLVEIVEVEVDDEELVGIVIYQRPPPRTELQEGSTVTINVGVEPEKGGKPPKPTPSPEPPPED
jgi:membrane peptidoglycan carboxypeptidase